MKFFLDSANIDEIRDAWSLGVVAGVTTNPTLVAREGRDFTGLLHEIVQVVEGPVSAEVISDGWQDMVREARELAAISANVVIKIPITADGLRATRILSEEGIQTNVTLVFSVTQAMMAARAGAAYVSPFVGRLDDVGANGMEVVADIASSFRCFDLETKIIAASIRSVEHVAAAIRVGADYATVPYKILSACLAHPLTDQGIKRFLADWNKMKQNM